MLDAGCDAPLIGDFHYNGHLLLTRHPGAAAALDKYRINPGKSAPASGAMSSSPRSARSRRSSNPSALA